jgi:hypothetical protein
MNRRRNNETGARHKRTGAGLFYHQCGSRMISYNPPCHSGVGFRRDF